MDIIRAFDRPKRLIIRLDSFLDIRSISGFLDSDPDSIVQISDTNMG
jgi:hypothetical protein